MKKNNENVTWEEAEKEIESTNHLAMEVLKQEQKKSRALIIGLTAGLAISVISTVTTVVCSKIERENLVQTNYQNNCDWRKLFSDYDFISQDGEGINNANYGEQGDLNNGAEDKVEEKSGNQ